MLAPGVRHLDEAAAVFQAMLEGWKRQQDSRYLREQTIAPRPRIVRRFAEFTGQYPWQWGPAEVEALTSSLVSGSRPPRIRRCGTTNWRCSCSVRSSPTPGTGWAEECERRFGEAPVQICHEWNTVAHLADYEGQPARRALTYDEVQALFDAAGARAGQIRGRGRKGALAALRDAAIIKVAYAYGLRPPAGYWIAAAAAAMSA